MTNPSTDHTILFEWDFDQFNRLVSNCDHDDTVQLALKYLPREGCVLEAGCGPGHVIEYLQTRGYDIEGVELNAPVVVEVKRRFPHLRITVGDVASLACADNTYAGLLSFGVVEHFRHGMRPPLAEHLRVLKPGGIAVVSVPSFSTLRRINHQLRSWFRPFRPRNWPGRHQPGRPVNRRGENGFIYHVMPRQGDFFEYWLRRKEFEQEIIAAGFEIVASLPTHHYTGLWSEFGAGWVSNDNRRFRPRPWAFVFHHMMRHRPFFHSFMHTIVARKKSL